VQVNYDFHENLTPEAMDKVLDDYRSKAQGAANAADGKKG
jgi:hypothetical protein